MGNSTGSLLAIVFLHLDLPPEKTLTYWLLSQ
jgi:hypothetical protein